MSTPTYGWQGGWQYGVDRFAHFFYSNAPMRYQGVLFAYKDIPTRPLLQAVCGQEFKIGEEWGEGKEPACPHCLQIVSQIKELENVWERES